MSNKYEKFSLNDRSVYELEALIDAGSEEAARLVLELLIDHLYSGTPVPYEYRFRLSLGLNKFVVEKQCADLLNAQVGITWLWSNRKFTPTKGRKRPYISTPPSKAKGRKPSDLGVNLRIFAAVTAAHSKLGRLRDSSSQKGAFSEVGHRFNLSSSAIEKRYYGTKKILDDVLEADAKHQESNESREKIRALWLSYNLEDIYPQK